MAGMLRLVPVTNRPRTAPGTDSSSAARIVTGCAQAPNSSTNTDVFLTREEAKLVKQLRDQGRHAPAPIFDQLGGQEQQRLQELLQRMLETRKD